MTIRSYGRSSRWAKGRETATLSGVMGTLTGWNGSLRRRLKLWFGKGFGRAQKTWYDK